MSNSDLQDGEHVHPESRTAEPAIVPRTNDVPAARSGPDALTLDAEAATGTNDAVGVPVPRGDAGSAPASEPAPKSRRLAWPSSLSLPFRLPTEEDPAPPTTRIIAITAWAALLALVGVAVGAKAFAGMLFTPGLPVWFEPAVIGAGLVSTALTAGALASVQHRQLPWLLLPGATIALFTALVLTMVAT